MRTNENIVVRHASGILGNQVVAKRWKGRPYLANKPKYPKNRQFSEAQLNQQEKFLDAAAYAKGVIDSENVPEIYVKKAKRGALSEYNVATRDFLRPPNVREIDESGYTGKPGEVIVVRAVDDCEVVSVRVAITKNGKVVEEGDAYRDPFNATLWLYTTSQENELPGTTVEAFAADRPGNVTAGVIEL